VPTRVGERERDRREHDHETQHAQQRQAERHTDHQKDQPHHGPHGRDDVTAHASVAALRQRVREPRIVRRELSLHLLEDALLVLGEWHPDSCRP